ncbi:multidrug efflux MFS transporter (plasmid) [Massilia forsythiae]|uniref:Multidrug efflux MFS transporter n=1 Tax=Massilia forsythiae TaxID=2728020 RepID=A0A7Z2W2I5_9BURK|nr:MFS transporter [Massilia forsythiae]QJE03666.1 multidrug efflux MFS transporter [Massilia forsythiae]
MRLLAAYLILLVHVMDTSIANVALLSVTNNLMIDAYDGYWMITAFGVGMATAIPFVPRVVDWLGAATTLTLVLGLSILSIALCGVADSFALLVLSRLLQGVTSGGVALLMQKLMMNYAGPERRAYALALWTSAITISPVFGPFIGAFVISFLDWHWLFLGQVPILVGAAMVIHDEFALTPSNPEKAPSLVSLCCFGGAMLCMEMVLREILTTEYRAPWAPLPWAGGTIVLLAQSWLRQRRTKSTLFDWQLLRNSAYLSYMLSASILSAITLCTSVVYTMWLQVVLQLGVLDVAKVLAAGSLIAGGLTALIGCIKNKRWLPLIVTAGMACQITSFFLVTRLTTEVSLSDLALPRIVAGFGVALCSPLGYLSVSELEANRVLAANSLGMFVRTMCANILVPFGSEGLGRLALLVGALALADGFGVRHDGAYDLGMARQLHGVLATLSATVALHVIYWIAIAVQCLLLLLLLRRNVWHLVVSRTGRLAQ